MLVQYYAIQAQFTLQWPLECCTHHMQISYIVWDLSFGRNCIHPPAVCSLLIALVVQSQTISLQPAEYCYVFLEWNNNGRIRQRWRWVHFKYIFDQLVTKDKHFKCDVRLGQVQRKRCWHGYWRSQWFFASACAYFSEECVLWITIYWKIQAIFFPLFVFHPKCGWQILWLITAFASPYHARDDGRSVGVGTCVANSNLISPVGVSVFKVKCPLNHWSTHKVINFVWQNEKMHLNVVTLIRNELLVFCYHCGKVTWCVSDMRYS
jgi:hypothetical protein